jgi:CRISPR/Cas system-associated exonuclease Cas4 (RecB family)
VTIPSFVHTGAREPIESIAQHVNTGLSTTEHRDRAGRLYASETGYCERQGAVLAQLPSTEISSASSTLYKKLGDTIETIILDALYEQGILVFRQFHLPDVGLDLGGYIDGIVLLNGKLHVLEIKTCGQLPSQPKPQHLHQAAIYSAITGFPAIIYYVSRHVASFDGVVKQAEFYIPAHGEVQRTAVYRAAYAHLSILEEVTPYVPSHITKEDQCGFCPLRAQCWHGAERTSWPAEVDSKKALAIAREAKQLADAILDAETSADRRNGIVKHISRIGNGLAKSLLKDKDWSTFFTPFPPS